MMYNTLMPSKRFIRLGLLTILFVPSVAVAYSSPEETLTNDENAEFFFPMPPHKGETLDRVAGQQASAAARREAQQLEIFQKQHANASSSAHQAAPDEEVDDTEWLEEETDTWTEPTDEELRDERILERVKARQIAEAAMQSREDTVLHSGAPLVPSGPATIVSMIVLLAVAAWTMYRAYKSEKVA